MAIVKLPIYLDSIGTVLVGILAGPFAGALTGALSNVLAGMIMGPTLIPFAVPAAAIGFLAGWAGRFGAMRSTPRAVIAGMVTGAIAARISAPISAYLFGGVTGGGTDLLVIFFRALGYPLEQATFMQGLTVDPLDKVVTFLLVAWVLHASPARLLDQYPRGLAATGRVARAWSEDP